MKILYIEHYAGSPNHGMEYRPYYLSREWVRRGHEVTIVASAFSHLRSRQPEPSGDARLETIDGVRYLWLPGPAYSGNGIGRVRNILAFLAGLRRLRRILPNETFDAVIASSTYPFDNGGARRLARRWNAIHVYEVHDLWPLSPMELGGYSKWHPAIVAAQVSEDRAYRKADAVVSLLPAAESYMSGRGLAPGKFHCVENGIDVSEWESGPKALPAETKTRLDSWRKGRFAVCYAGAHGIANALGAFVDAARQLPTIGFVLVGQGPEKESLKTRAAGLENVLFLDALPKAAIPPLLAEMDALYIGLQRQSLFRFGISPNKLMDYMMAGKPIVCAIEAGNDPVSEADCGFTIEPENPRAIAEALSVLAALEPERRARLGGNGRDYVMKHHDYRVLASRFERLLQDGLDRKRPGARGFPTDGR